MPLHPQSARRPCPYSYSQSPLPFQAVPYPCGLSPAAPVLYNFYPPSYINIHNINMLFFLPKISIFS